MATRESGRILKRLGSIAQVFAVCAQGMKAESVTMCDATMEIVA